ncbi:MAG TPA: PTS sugar transporter subunit IIA [Candidatus Cloacimonadota bacterium]|nr:PTS sugar transporter subunit IIA [Candidatus Cloacimonadota bacterium]
MKLISLLDPKLIYFEEDDLPKHEIYRYMVDKICKFYKLPQCGKELYELILKRDAEAPTVYPNGLDIPHVRLDNFNDTLICICIPRRPITDNGQTIRLICLILTDKTSAKLYLNIVSAIVRASKSEDFFTKLLNQKDGNEVYNILKELNLAVKEDLTVKDIMTVEPIVIKETATLKEMGDLLSGHNITNLPVINEAGYFVGEVNILQYLKVGLPDYLMMLDNLLFLKSYEPFETLYEQEEKVLVKTIMTKPEHVLNPDNSIIEAVFKMLQTNRRFFTVVQEGKVAGTITAMDIFRKVVRS